MSASAAPTAAQAEIFGPGTRWTRRAEIYESDGVTFFQSAPRMIDGSVSVSYGRDERRSIDLTFDNTDKSLAHYPGGFWYDKVIKIYRGVQYNDSADLPTDIVGDLPQNFWRFTESTGTNIADTMGGHAGTVTGSPTLAAPGRLGGESAIQIANSTANYVNVGDFTDLTFTDNIFTIELEAVIYTPSSTAFGLLAKGTSGQWEYSIIGNRNTAGTVQFQCWNNAGTSLALVTVPYVVGAWAIWTFRGDGQTLYGFRDGVLYTTAAFTGTMQNGTAALEIGRGRDGSATYSFTGRIDNVAIYRSSLSNDRIAAHALASSTGRDTTLRSWEVQVGEFLIDQIESQNFPHTVHVTGRDYTKKLLVSKFVQATSFSQGQYVIDVIKTIATNGGISKFIWPSTTDPSYNSQLGKSWAWERGTERWKAMKDLADAFGYEIFFDNAGYLVLRTFRDPVTSPESFTFTTGTYGNLATYKKATADSRIYNHIVVTGEATDVIPAFGEASNTQPDSPTNITKLGDRVYQYSSSFITTNTQAQSVAQNFLKLHALEEYSLDLEAIVIPWLEVGEIIEFLDPDPNPGDPTRFLLTDFSVPLALGPMSLTGRRVQIVT